MPSFTCSPWCREALKGTACFCTEMTDARDNILALEPGIEVFFFIFFVFGGWGGGEAESKVMQRCRMS